jgi:hypothetical protein
MLLEVVEVTVLVAAEILGVILVASVVLADLDIIMLTLAQQEQDLVVEAQVDMTVALTQVYMLD